ncbi:NadD Nicotinic acid mononucleotide adenylyltransferase [Burkholderiales bacterium]
MIGSKPGRGPTESRPLGLFGGRFDPVHRAHIAIAQAVADELNLDEVRWIVTGDPAHKPAFAPAEDRLQMTRLALHELGDPRMMADDREVIAAKNGRSNYTADTVLRLQQEYPGRKLIWILGEDQLQNFLTWSRWQWLIHQVDLAVCARPGAEGFQVSKTITGAGGKIHWVPLALDTVSSTAIRTAVRAGLLKSNTIPNGVYRYITAKLLYR